MSPLAPQNWRALIFATLFGLALGLPARADEQPLGFMFEGHIDATLETELEFDLDGTTSENLGTVQPELEVSLGFRPLRQLAFTTTWQLNRDFVFVDGGAREDRTERLELLVAQVHGA